MSLNRIVEVMLRQQVSAKPELSTADLEGLLRLLAKWRHQLLSNSLVTRDGMVVRAGPFAGMIMGAHSSEGGHAPRLLGCYEHELHPHLERLIARGFPTVLNIGCSTGYYAIGLARRMPGAILHAHDTDANARNLCHRLAEANGVAERVRIGGLFAGDDFARFVGQDVLLVTDIEGEELALLDPEAYPALRCMSLVVECHDVIRPGIADTLTARFAPTHRIERIANRPAAPPLPGWMQELGHLDQLLATWEWRSGPTPWLVMEPA